MSAGTEASAGPSRRLYAVDMNLEVPGRAVHEIAADGLSMSSRFEFPGAGIVEASVGWPDLATAEANYENARVYAVAKAADLLAQVHALPPGPATPAGPEPW